MSVRRVLVVLTVALVVLGAAGFFIVRRAMDADAIRGAAEARLSAMLGQPVTIGGIDVSVFPVPSVSGSAIVIGSQPDAPELALNQIRIVPRVASLFRGPYVIREVTLEGLAVRVVREPPGRWRFPAVVPAPGGGESTGIIVERVRLTGGRVSVIEVAQDGRMRETSSIDEVEGEAVSSGEGLRISPIRGRVGRAEIAGSAAVNAQEARIEFAVPAMTGDDLPRVLGLAATEPPAFLTLPQPAAASLSIRIDRARSQLSGTGSIKAAEVGFYSLRLRGFESPFRTDGAQLTFQPATFTINGGAHRGTMTVDLSRTPARWTLDSKISKVDVGDFLAALTSRAQPVDGTADAVAALHGAVGDTMPQGLAGRVGLDVADGVIREFPLLAAINRALRLAEGDTRHTQFERLSATFTLPGAVTGSAYASTENLVLLAREVRVEAAGRIGFDRSLNLSGQAVLSPERTASAVRSVHELSGLRNDRGELELPIRITGSIDDPSFQIDLKAAVGRSLKEELRRRIKGLFRR
jgi:hypothetical protein